MPESELLSSLFATVKLYLSGQAPASSDMVPWGFVVFSGLVLLGRHLRWPCR